MAQKSVEIYTWQYCPFCVQAKALLDSKGVEYTEFVLDVDTAEDEHEKRASWRVVKTNCNHENEHSRSCAWRNT